MWNNMKDDKQFKENPDKFKEKLKITTMSQVVTKESTYRKLSQNHMSFRSFDLCHGNQRSSNQYSKASFLVFFTKRKLKVAGESQTHKRPVSPARSVTASSN